MKTYRIGFSYVDDGFAIIPEVDDEDTARAMAVELLKELNGATITSIKEFNSAQEAVESFQESATEGTKYVN